MLGKDDLTPRSIYMTVACLTSPGHNFPFLTFQATPRQTDSQSGEISETQLYSALKTLWSISAEWAMLGRRCLARRPSAMHSLVCLRDDALLRQLS